jgi:DNA-binding LytR/AlgR family response regulator
MDSLARCVIVDDEPVARTILRNYCGHLPFLTIAGEFGNALEARDCILTEAIDLLFLDINMPILNGLAFLHTLTQPPRVIFTTAYQEYAVQAFDVAACDYLLKPFSLERFIVAVDRALASIAAASVLPGPVAAPIPTPPVQEHLFVRSEGNIYKVLFRDMVYAEAQGNYTKIVTVDGIVQTKVSFTLFLAQLPKDLFARVHRSFVINLGRINRIEGNKVWVQQQEVPIAGAYKDEFFKSIGL